MRALTVGMVAALVLSGCGPRVHSLALPADAAPLDNLEGLAEALVNRKTVTVSGEGMVRVAPDTATVIVALEQKGKDANSTQQAVNVAGQAVITAWKAAGIPDKAIQTVGLDLYPEYARPESTGEEHLVGYRAVMRLQARTTPDKPGILVDAALNAGANRLEGVTFSREDATKARQEAIAKAVDKAMQEAKAALGSLDLKLKEVQSIDISGGSSPPMPMAARMYAGHAEAAATPVQPGELEIRAVVTLVATF
jgi:uncharacterized protein YggE